MKVSGKTSLILRKVEDGNSRALAFSISRKTHYLSDLDKKIWISLKKKLVQYFRMLQGALGFLIHAKVMNDYTTYFGVPHLAITEQTKHILSICNVFGQPYVLGCRWKGSNKLFF